MEAPFLKVGNKQVSNVKNKNGNVVIQEYNNFESNDIHDKKGALQNDHPVYRNDKKLANIKNKLNKSNKKLVNLNNCKSEKNIFYQSKSKFDNSTIGEANETERDKEYENQQNNSGINRKLREEPNRKDNSFPDDCYVEEPSPHKLFKEDQENLNEVDLCLDEKKHDSNGEYDNSYTEKVIKDQKLRIEVEYLEITYKLCDDFGLVFKPFIQILVSENDPVELYTVRTNKHDKLNMSDISMSDNNSSVLSQNLNLSGDGSILGGESSGCKIYSFKEVIYMLIKDKNIFRKKRGLLFINSFHCKK